MRFARRWFVPDLALLAAIVTLIYSLAGFHASRELFRDATTGWHLVTGERILEGYRFPRQDPYSFVGTGAPWLARDWAADCLMGLAFTRAGLAGVAAIFVVALALVSWIWFRLTWAVNGNFFLACLLFVPMVSNASVEWLAVPRVLGWILLLAAVWFFEQPRPRFRLRDYAVVVLGSIVWANVDETFFLLPAIALIYAISHFARPLIWNADASVELARGRSFLLTAVLSALATLANPYGWRLAAPSLECHSTLVLLIGVIGGAAALAQKKLAHFLLLVAFACEPRGVPAAALLLLPLANGAITDGLRRAHDLRAAVRHGLSAFLTYSDRLRLLDARRTGFAWGAIAAVLVLLWFRLPTVAAHTGFPPERFPVVAANELTLVPPDARLLAPADYGGYVVFRFQGARKVLAYEGNDFARVFEARPGWQAEVERLDFTHALLPDDSPLVPALEQIGWKVVFRDEVATLLAR
ncbi:MAG TPA: hypothetical protein VKU01_13270 [Bryobacteraceae bacterium]|nr:hypothetical protein [Bryobacteraceae bacterium]